MNVVFFSRQQDEQNWVSEYESSLSGKAESTIDAYLRIVKQFVRWVTDKPGGEDGFKPILFTRTAVEEYFKNQISKASISHKQRVKTVLNDFANWLMEQDAIKKNPVRGIEIPAQSLLAPRILTPDQRYILKNLVERQGDQRSAALFALGYWAGCRVSDVSHLMMNNVRVGPKIGDIIVGFKGNKTRDIPLLNEVRRPLYEYIHDERQKSKHAHSPYVFPSQRGDRLTEYGIHHWFRAMKKIATNSEWPLIEDITYHDLRHDFAHRAREAGWPIEYVAVYLGHIKKKGTPAIETTARYTQPSREAIKEKLLDLKG